MRILAFLGILLFAAFPAAAQTKEFSWHDKWTTPFLASQMDPRFSYMLYVPKDYDENGTKTYPLVVLVHGTERWPHHYIEHNQAFAEENGVILMAPLFPLNTHGNQDLETYKLIDYKGTRYDLVLLSMVDEVASKYRLRDNKFYMHGFSGGGHFTHRFFYLHPHRLHAISIGAPGMITLIDNKSDWWVGTKNLYARFNAKLNLNAMRNVKVHMVAGAKDLDEWNEPIERDSPYWMGENVKGADYASTGKNRVERLATLKKNFEANGIKVQMELVPDAEHDETQLFPTVQKFLKSALAQEQ